MFLASRRSFLFGSAAALASVSMSAVHAADSTTSLLAVTAQHPDVAAAIRLYESWVDEQMAYRQLPGIAIGIVQDQNLIWSRGFGYADVAARKPVTPKTAFRMASNSKMFTALAVMQLRDAGKLRLDDPVSKYLPWFKPKPAAEDDPPITIEHLITHASGLPREAADAYWVTFKFPNKKFIEDTIAGQSAVFSPNERWKYSNLALGLAGLVVEVVSSEKFNDYQTKHILGPLGMKDTSFDVETAGLAKGYGRRMPDGSRQLMPWTDTRDLAAATGLTSTVEDMAKFVSLQFRKGPAGGSQILKSTTLREMHRVRFMQPTWTSGQGLGFAVNRRDGKLYVGHGGSLAGYKTTTSFNIENKLGVIVLTNGDDARPDQFAERAFDIIGAAVIKAAKAPEKPKEWDVSWSRYAGLYRSLWGDTQVVEMNRELVLITPTSENPTEGMQKLVPQGNGVFKLEGPSGGAAVGELVTFQEQGGKVVQMRVGNMTQDRVGS